MPRGLLPEVESVAPGCVSVLFRHPEYRELFPIADVVDQAVRAGV